MFDVGQWQEIERISGIPFRRTLPQRISANSPSGVDAELADRTTASLALDFHLASSISQATEADVVRLQRDLLAVEVESGSERERNRALEEENANLEEHLRELSDNLQVRSEELSSKENEMNILSNNFVTLQNEKRRAEEELRARVKGLENELANQKKTDDELRVEQSSTLQELEKSLSRIAVYEERVQHLHSNLNDTIQTSKQRESKAIATVQAEAKQNTTILEAKLQSMNEQLLKAEEREQQASLRLEEARREASCTHKNMYNIIANERKELTASHSADVERMNLELDSAKKRLISLSEEVQEANLRLAKQSEKSTRNLNDAENRMKEIKHELGSRSALCDKLQGELGQVRCIAYTPLTQLDLYYSVDPISYYFSIMLRRSPLKR
jgi:DNA repair exonuclease SbcCD ATPase subunit